MLTILAISSVALLQEPVREVLELEWRGSAVLEGVEVEAGTELFVSASSADFDPVLLVLDADGRELARDADGGGGTTAFVRPAASARASAAARRSPAPTPSPRSRPARPCAEPDGR